MIDRNRDGPYFSLRQYQEDVEDFRAKLSRLQVLKGQWDEASKNLDAPEIFRKANAFHHSGKKESEIIRFQINQVRPRELANWIPQFMSGSCAP